MDGYFDYNATTPICPEAIRRMTEAMSEPLGNPSSMHRHGRHARTLIDEARHRVAEMFEASPSDVVFTSGATEANNLLLRGLAASTPALLIVTSTLEHPSVLRTVEALGADGEDTVVLDVDGNGEPDYERLHELCTERDTVVTWGWANGESGHVADVAKLAAAVSETTVLHMDAAQAAGRLRTPLAGGVAAMSMSAHKFAGPQGVGALIAGAELRLRLDPVITGGPQEGALRAGTENVTAIVGMGAAAAQATARREAEAVRLAALRDALWGDLGRTVPGLVRITPENGLPNTLTVALSDVESQSIVAGLDLAGFSVSAGSACAAGSPEPSHVAAGLRLATDLAQGLVRISLGYATTAEGTEKLAAAFTTVVTRARAAA